MNKTFFRLTLIAVVFVITACSELHPTQDYAKRVANVLDTSYERGKALRLPLPAKKHLSPNIEASDISAFDFFKTGSCKLYQSIAKRNDILGKIAPHSQSLFIDLAILNDLPSCIRLLTQKNETQLVSTLNKIYIQKQKELPKKLWAAILGSDENRGFWSSNAWNHSYPTAPPTHLDKSLHELTAFSQNVLNGQYALSDEEVKEIENNLKHLRKGDGGQLLTSLVLLNQQLEFANTSIHQRLNKPLCKNGSPVPKSEHFQNVVTKFFIADIQRWAVKLHKRYDELIPTYIALENILIDYAPIHYQRWVTQRNSLFGFSLAATKKHVLNVKKLYQQCGIQVGQ